MANIVLVTGGSGYLASHIIHQLLDDASIGKIRATIRNLSDTHKVKHLNDYAESLGKHIEWCPYRVPCGLPFLYTSEDVERDIVRPAVEGTLSVLRACQQYASSTVKRVVITGSGTAIFNLLNIDPNKLYTEKDWNTEITALTSPYPYSKMLSEKAAWNYVETERPSFSITTMLPGYILGPPLNDYKSVNEFNSSLKVLVGHVKAMLEQGVVKAVPSPSLVDVRDMAQAHIAAAKQDNCANERLFLAASGSVWANELILLQKYALEKLPGDHPLSQTLASITPVVEGDLEATEKKTLKVDVSTLLSLIPEVGVRPREDTLLDTLTWLSDRGFVDPMEVNTEDQDQHSHSFASESRQVVRLNDKILKEWLIPSPPDTGDKESRGKLLIVGGSRQVPGALILAALAAMRTGIGKVRLATIESISTQMGLFIPEARIYQLPETRDGHISASAADIIAVQANMVDAVLIGPGMLDEEEACRLIDRLLPQLKVRTSESNGPMVILDAAGLTCFTKDKFPREALHRLNGNVIMTPHQGEMAHLLLEKKEKICDNPIPYALEAASLFHSVIALKGHKSFIVSSDPKTIVYHNETGHIGLATAGSGDVLSGIIAGLAARHCQPQQAAAWGCYLHGRAGEVLSERMGSKLGFFARELPDEIPGLLHGLTNWRE